MTINQQVGLAARPTGMVTQADFAFTEEPVPAPAAGEFVVDVSR
jgi:NADPH-dependent curcumin reductase CurA